MFLLSLLLTLLASPPLALDVTPRWVHDNFLGKRAEVKYTIQIEKLGGTLCTGWMYPIVGMSPYDYPQRKSCRANEWHRVEEQWGGSKYPFPYQGRYMAFAEVADGDSIRSITVDFTLLKDEDN